MLLSHQGQTNQRKKCLFLAWCQVYFTSEFPLCYSCLYELRGYFPFFFRNHHFVVNEFIHIVWGKNSHKIVFYVFIPYIFENLFNLEIADSFAHFFLLTEQIIYVFFYFFLCFFYYVICHIRFEGFFHAFIFNFRCS